MEETTLEQAQAKIKELEEINAKNKADGDRGVQKILQEKKEMEKMLERQQKLSSDGSVITELADQDPVYAQTILDKFFNGMKLDEAIAQVGGSPKEVKVDIQGQINKGIQESKIQDKIDSFVDGLGISDDDKVKFLETLDDNTPQKGLSLKNLNKVLKHTYSDVSGDIDFKDMKNKEMIANTMAPGKSTNPKKTSEKESVKKEMSDFNKRRL